MTEECKRVEYSKAIVTEESDNPTDRGGERYAGILCPGSGDLKDYHYKDEFIEGY